jgi:hypothetical protein
VSSPRYIEGGDTEKGGDFGEKGPIRFAQLRAQGVEFSISAEIAVPPANLSAFDCLVCDQTKPGDRHD